MEKPTYATRILAVLGLISFVGFLAVFLNVPWEWNMFMDEVQTNTWMPFVPSVLDELKKEIAYFWGLGRFYPAKYLVNILKWKYLPNDPFVFRYFNFLVFFASTAAMALAALKAAGYRLGKEAAGFFIFSLGAVILHKPTLEVISLSSIGEGGASLFLALGTLCLFSGNRFLKWGVARIFFLLVALSKEPAAIVFFASACFYAVFAWREPERRRSSLANALADLLIFFSLLGLVVHVMLQGSFTKGAYFGSTPWMRYATDFIYTSARYALWTSPFLAFFLMFSGGFKRLLARENASALAASAFFLVFGLSYMAFMSTQGRAAYQTVPSSFALFGLFSLLSAWILREGGSWLLGGKRGVLLLALFACSYFISVSRWERFVRGIVEPYRAVANLLNAGGPMTLLVPVGELRGHLEVMAKAANPEALILDIDSSLPVREKDFRGKVFVLEFPYYMGELGGKLPELEEMGGGWAGVSDGGSYRIYRWKRAF